MAQVAEIRIDRSLIRALKSFDSDRLRWLDKAAAAAPITQLRFGPVRTWVVSDPDVARKMLISDAASWERPIAATIPIRLGIGENLFTMPDDAWDDLQPQIAPAFRKRALDDRLNSMNVIIEEAVAEIPRNQSFDVELEMGTLALQLAAWVLFGDRLARDRALVLAAHQQQLITWVGHRLGQLRSIVPFTFGRQARAMRVHQCALNQYADELVEQLTKGGAGEDVGGRLTHAVAKGSPLSNAAKRSQVLGLLLAGNETTAAALSWAIVNGVRNPNEWEKLRTDAGAARPFLDETMRLTPPVWGFARRPKKRPAQLDGHRVGRTEVVTIYLRGMNRDPQRWIDPLTFLPDRHRHSSPLDATTLSFGLGPRGCIGQHLAMAEMLAVLPALAQAGDFSLDAADGDLVEDASFALRVKGGLRATLYGVGALAGSAAWSVTKTIEQDLPRRGQGVTGS